MSPENQNSDFEQDDDTEDLKKEGLSEGGTNEIIDMMFSAWAMKTFSGIFYKLDHAFVHFLEGNAYRDDLISNDLKILSAGNPRKMFEQLQAFKDDLTKKLVKSLD